MILRALVLRPFQRETIRTVLTVAGIAVGVAVVVAIQLANQSALRAFRESVDAVAGRANYQIVSESVPLDENILRSLQPFWQQGLRMAPVIDAEGVIEPDRSPVRILAVDLLSDLHFRDYRYARFVTSAERRDAPIEQYLELFRRDSIVLPAAFAAERRLTLGSTVVLNVNAQRATMVVRGLLESSGPATAFNGAMVVADISAAQAAFGLGGKLSRVDLIVPDAQAASMLSSLRRVLPTGTRIERPSRRNERVEKMLRSFRVNLFALAGVALLVGVFLVYNTVLISILRRRRDVGIIRTLGAAPRQVLFAFLAEGAIFGLAGSIAGIALGNLLATAILSLVGRTVNALYITSQPSAVVLTPGVIVLGVAVGVVLSIAAAVQPSVEASRVPPVTMIRSALQQRVAHPAMLAAAAIVAFLAAAGASLIRPWQGIAVGGYVAVLFVVAGFALLSPMIVRATAATMRPLFSGVFGVIGRLAVASSLRRTSIASSALAVAIGMMVAVALMVGSFRETVRIWVDQTVSSDLWLRPSKGLSNAQAAVFPAAISDDLARIPFIAAIDRVRGRDLLYGEDLIWAGSGDFDVMAKHGDLPMVTPPSSASALTAGLRTNGVVVSESFAIKFDKGVGDTVILPVAGGPRRFPVTGIYRDYSNDRGAVVMDRRLYVRSFGDDTINTVVIFLKAGADREQARRQLESTLGPKYGAFAVSNESIRGEVMRIFDQTFLITYALLGVSLVVAVLGIVNTLAALILERSRELALLRVGGMSRGEIRSMILLESAVIAVASTAAGIVMGYALSWILINVINKQSFGWTIEFHAPLTLIAVSLAVTFVAAVAAGFVPARLANRIDVVTAIKSE